MHLKLILLISVIYLLHTLEAATPKNDVEVIVQLDSLQKEIAELQSRILKERADGRLEGQVQIFQKLYQNPERCSCDISGYIFDDWTTIQRRVDGSENFHRNWNDYRSGFGDKHENFFIGLEELHTLTSSQEPHELLVLLGDDEGQIAYAKYDNFVVGSEKENYELKKLGSYSGDAGDSLRYHVGKQFSTFDVDNNDELQRCAKVWVGGWWFGDCFDR